MENKIIKTFSQAVSLLGHLGKMDISIFGVCGEIHVSIKGIPHNLYYISDIDEFYLTVGTNEEERSIGTASLKTIAELLSK